MLIEPMDVLMIEDNDEHYELIRRRLGQVSHGTVRLDRAGRLSEGLERLRQAHYSAVLLDLMLPDSRGVETCRRVTEQCPETPVIVLTAADMEDEGMQAIESRAEDFLLKSKLDGDLVLRSLRCAVERGARRHAEQALIHSKGELAAAREIQLSLLPKAPPLVRWFEIAGKSRPAEAVSGDCFDWLRLPGGDTLVTIGDVAGHGVPAALVMAQATAAVRTLAEIFDDLGEIMSRCNRLLHRELPLERFMSLAFFRINERQKRIQYCSAGHPAALHFDRDGRLRQRLRSTDVILGMVDPVEYRESVPIEVSPGDTLVLVTDGVTESESLTRRQFGEEGVIEIMREKIRSPATELIDTLFDAIAGHCHPLLPGDDMTVVVIRHHLPHLLGSAAAERTAVREVSA